jgi:hypothetical protein
MDGSDGEEDVMNCEVCGEKAAYYIVDHNNADPSIPEHSFCDRHYEDFIRNEIEIPSERLKLLE